MIQQFSKKLPQILQTDTQKEFFAATVDQLFSSAEVEQAQGFIGRRSSAVFDPKVDNYLGEPTKLRAAYQLEPIAYAVTSALEETNEVFYEDFLNYLQFHGGNIGNHDRLFGDTFYSFAPPIDVDKYLNYQNYLWLEDGGPTIFIQYVGSGGAAEFDNIIESLIIGGTQFNTSQNEDLRPRGLDLSSGMRVRFEGSSSYDRTLFVEGVGRQIRLVEELTTIQPGDMITSILWDNSIIADGLEGSGYEINLRSIDSLDNAGTGYTAGDVLGIVHTHPSGETTQATINVDTVSGSAVATYSIADAGDYLFAPPLSPVETETSILVDAQDETDYDGTGDNGSFVGGDGAGGTAYSGADTITLNDGTVITVDSVDGNGDVVTFDITTPPTNSFPSGTIRTQTSTSGTGTGFTLTPGDNNETAAGTGATFEVTIQSDLITVVGGTFTVAGTLYVTEVGGSGEALKVELVDRGTYTVFPSSPAATSSAGAGTGLQVELYENGDTGELWDNSVTNEGFEGSTATDLSDADYLTIERGSCEGSPWTRTNRWFNVDIVNTAQTLGQIIDATIVSGGINYVVGDQLPVDGDGINGVVTVTSVDGSGTITGIRVSSRGQSYTYGSIDQTGASGTTDTVLWDATDSTPTPSGEAWDTSFEWDEVLTSGGGQDAIIDITLASAIDRSTKATRPIIEFMRDLQLYDFGNKFLFPIEVVADNELYADVSGQPEGVVVDGVTLKDGMKMIFLDPSQIPNFFEWDQTPDSGNPGPSYWDSFAWEAEGASGAISRYIWQVEISGGLISLVKVNPNTGLVDANSPPVPEGGVVIATLGTDFAGDSFYQYRDTISGNYTWRQCQVREEVNTAPLYELYDYNAIELADTLEYPGSDFEGNEIFSYRILTAADLADTGGSLTADSVLGFPLTLTGLQQISDIVFENDLETNRVTYDDGEIPGYYFYRKWSADAYCNIETDSDGNQLSTYKTNWLASDEPERQRVIDRFLTTSDTEDTFTLSASPRTSDEKFDIRVNEGRRLNTDEFAYVPSTGQVKIFEKPTDSGFEIASGMDSLYSFTAIADPAEVYIDDLYQERDLDYIVISSVQLDSVAVASGLGGSGYMVDDLLEAVGGTTENPAHIRVVSVDGGGAITGVFISNRGVYAEPPSSPFAVTGGTGTGAYLEGTFVDATANTFTIQFIDSDGNGSIVPADSFIEVREQGSGAPGENIVVEIIYSTYDNIEDSDVGFFQIPYGLEKNPNNLEITEQSWNDFAPHMVSIIENQNIYLGTAFGSVNNYRDTAKDGSEGEFIIQSQAPLLKSMLVSSSNDLDLIEAIRFSSKEYERYKNKFVKEAKNLIDQGFTPFNDGDSIPIDQWVDECIRRIIRGREYSTAFNDTYMLAYGTVYEEETFDFVSTITSGTETTSFNTLTNFIDLTDKRNAMYIYVDSTIQRIDVDYTISNYNPIEIQWINAPSGTFTITARLYENMAPSYIPATAQKLGLAPIFRPAVMSDDSYQAPIDILLNHDGSRTPLYNDYRDDLLFEFETRIYNGIIDSFRNDYDVPLQEDTYKPGKYRTTRWDTVEWNKLLRPSFFKWVAAAKADYITNEFYDAGNTWTWNYSEVTDADGETLPGYWRGIFDYYYDTQTPQSTPWEMLGFTHEPSWWATEYGSGPWANTSPMWDDLEAGTIKDGYRAGTDSRYARPGLTTNSIPVDNTGALLSEPLLCIANDGSLTEPTSVQAAKGWMYGDLAPVEYAWFSGEQYSFAVSEALFLARPGEYGEQFWDPEHTFTVPAQTLQIVSDRDSEYKRIGNSELYVHGETVDGIKQVNTGWQVWVSSRLRALGRDLGNDFGQLIRTLDVKLGHKMASFTNKDTLNVFVEGISVASQASNLLVPQENITVSLHTSPPVKEYSYGGVLIRAQADGTYQLFGYDILAGEFNYIPRKEVSQKNTNINVGGQPESFTTWKSGNTYAVANIVRFNTVFYRCAVANSDSTFDQSKWQKLSKLPTVGGIDVTYKPEGTNTTSQLQYGEQLDTEQEVFDLIIGYGEWLSNEGWVFENKNPESGMLEDWLSAAKQFLLWTQTNWEANSIVMISPAATGVTLEAQEGYPAAVEKITNGVYSILNKEGVVIDPRNTIIKRDGRSISVIPAIEQVGIYGCRVNTTETESIITFDNTTDFNDTIYDPLLGTRLARLAYNGRRTTNWTGKLEAGGYIITENNLIPNFENMVDSIRFFHDTETILDNPDTENAARHLIGFDTRSYYDDLQIENDAQFQFYQGSIRQKGTINSIRRLERSSVVGDATQETEVYEEWALKVAEYGSICGNQMTEFFIQANEVKVDPQLVQLSYPSSNSGGTVTSIDIVSRVNTYTSVPTVTIENDPRDTTGSGASAIAVLDSDNTLLRIDILSAGSDYTYPPTVYIGDTVVDVTDDRAVANITYTIDEDDASDDVILIDVDDNVRWPTKPTGIACAIDSDLWSSTVEAVSYTLPNAGNVSILDTNFRFVSTAGLDALATLASPPSEKGETIHVAYGENEDFAIYILNNLREYNRELTVIEQLNSDNAVYTQGRTILNTNLSTIGEDSALENATLTFSTNGSGEVSNVTITNGGYGYWNESSITITEASDSGYVAGSYAVIPVTNINGVLALNIDQQTITSQNSANFTGVGEEGTFTGGSGYVNLDTITLSDGTTVQVDTTASGVITAFTITGNSVTPFSVISTLTQTSTSGIGTGFTLTVGGANVELATTAGSGYSTGLTNQVVAASEIPGATQSGRYLSNSAEAGTGKLYIDNILYDYVFSGAETATGVIPISRGTGYTIGDKLSVNGGFTVSSPAIINVDSIHTIEAQTQDDFQDVAPNGAYVGGTGYAAVRNTFASATDVDTTNSQITITSHGYTTGDSIVMRNGGTLPGGLSDDTIYYVIRIDANTFRLSSSAANAIAGVSIDITSVGTGTHSISDTLSLEDGSVLTVDTIAVATIAAQDETDFNNSPTTEGTFTGGQNYAAADTITLADNTVITVDAISSDVQVIVGQTETEYDSGAGAGTFAAGSNYDVDDTITLSDGSEVTVVTVSTGAVVTFEVTGASTSGETTGATRTQSSTSGSGTGFTLTTGTINEIAFGDVSNFTITTAGDAVNESGATVAQSSTSGSGAGFTITLDTDNEDSTEGVVYGFTIYTAGDALASSGLTLRQATTTSTGVGFQLTLDSANEEILEVSLDTGGDYDVRPEIISSDHTSLAFTANTITRTGGTSFVSLGFGAGQRIVITDAEDALNNGTFEIESVTSTVITITESILVVNASDTTATLETETASVVTVNGGTGTGATFTLEEFRPLYDLSKDGSAIEDGTIDSDTEFFILTNIRYNNTTNRDNFADADIAAGVKTVWIDDNGEGSWEVQNVTAPIIAAQTEADYDGGWTQDTGDHGTFLGGTNHAIADVITMSDGSTVTVDDISDDGVVTEFTITTASTDNVQFSDTLTQDSTTGSGIAFSLTVDSHNLDNDNIAYTQREVQDTLIDTNKFKNAFVYEASTGDTIVQLPVYDPFKGIIPGPADLNITWKSRNDPARYTNSAVDSLLSDTRLFGSKQVGKLWWDLSTSAYLYYEQGTDRYRRDNWGKLIDGSSVDIYEWTRSTVAPASYTGDGTVRSTTEYVVNKEYDRNLEEVRTFYYFWVKDRTVVPEGAERTLAGFEVANLLANPSSQLYQWFSPISQTAFMFSGVEGSFTDSDNIVQINYRRDAEEKPKHVEWQLGREGDVDYVILDKHWNKMVDSLCGFTDLIPINSPDNTNIIATFQTDTTGVDGATEVITTDAAHGFSTGEGVYYSQDGGVEDVGLTDGTMYYVNVITTTTLSLHANKTNAITDSSRIDLTAAGTETHKLRALTDDLNNFTNALPSASDNTMGYLIVPDPRLSDTERLGIETRPLQTMFEDMQAARRIFVDKVNDLMEYVNLRDENPTWNSSLTTNTLWEWEDWYEEGYTAEDTIPTFQVSAVNDMDNIEQILDGDIVRVTGTRWRLFEYDEDNDTFVLVAREASKLVLLDTIYTSDPNLPDAIELRELIAALKDEVFVLDRTVNSNLVFFALLNYVFSEQEDLDWAFKTTYIFLKQQGRTLMQDRVYQNDPFDSAIEYITEFKPYQTKIRDFRISRAAEVDLVPGTAEELTRDFTVDMRYDRIRGGDLSVAEMRIAKFESQADNRWDGYTTRDGDTTLIRLGAAGRFVGSQRTLLEDIADVDSDILEAYITDPSVATIQIDTDALGSVTAVNIIDGGQGYYEGGTFVITDNTLTGNDNATILYTVNTSTAKGTIDSVFITNAGNGYTPSQSGVAVSSLDMPETTSKAITDDELTAVSSINDLITDDFAFDFEGLYLTNTEFTGRPTLISAAISAAGTGYVVGDILSLDAGSGTPISNAQFRVATIGGSGDITSLQLINGGSYQQTPTVDPVDLLGGSGSGASVTNLLFEYGSTVPFDSTPHDQIGWDSSQADPSIEALEGTPLNLYRTIVSQTEADFNGGSGEGTFTGGSGYSASDTIVMNDGTEITVDTVSTGAITEFTISGGSTSSNTSGATLTQSSTSGGGTGFTLTLGTANQSSANFFDVPAEETFSGTGTKKEFTLTTEVPTIFLFAVVDGVEQRLNVDYFFIAGELVFITAPSIGVDNIQVYTYIEAGDLINPQVAEGITEEMVPLDPRENLIIRADTFHIALSDGGTGYTLSDVLTVDEGSGNDNGTPMQITVTSVAGGVIDGFSITDPGDYSTYPSNPLTVTGGTGSGAQFTLGYVSWTLHEDTQQGVNYYRNADSASTTLASNIDIDNYIIPVDDVTVLYTSAPSWDDPAYVWIGTELVQYTEVDTTANLLKGCQRSYRGTHKQSHNSGVKIFSAEDDQLITTPEVMWTDALTTADYSGTAGQWRFIGIGSDGLSSIHFSDTSDNSFNANVTVGESLVVTDSEIGYQYLIKDIIDTGELGIVTITAPGTGYQVGETIDIDSVATAGTGVAAEVGAVDVDGGILYVRITNRGSGYTDVGAVAVTNSEITTTNGSGATMNAFFDTEGLVCALPDRIINTSGIIGEKDSLTWQVDSLRYSVADPAAGNTNAVSVFLRAEPGNAL